MNNPPAFPSSYFEDHGWSPSEYYYPVIKDIELRLKERNT